MCTQGGHAQLERRADLVQRADVRICAFDIETTKLPLQFPNAQFDQASLVLLICTAMHPAAASCQASAAPCPSPVMHAMPHK